MDINSNKQIRNDRNDPVDKQITQDRSPKFGSTGHGLTQIIEMVSIQDFWHLGIVPTAYDNFNRKLEVAVF